MGLCHIRHRKKWRLLSVILSIYVMVAVLISRRYSVDMDFNYGQYLDKSWTTKDFNISLLTLFTTWDPTMQKPIVYSNSVANWRSLSKDINIIAFTNNTDVKNIAKRGNWDVLPLRRLACYGTPVLRTMFQTAMLLPKKSKLYAFSNADIIFNDGLIKTLKELVKNPHFDRGPILIVGKRIDVNISLLNEPEVHTVHDVDKLATYGKISHGMAADYFITNDLFPWEFVPDVVIGRPMIDNWLVWYARQVGAKVVDVTGTVVAVHQLANGMKTIKLFCNEDEMWKSKLLPYLPILEGMIECASYETQYNSNGGVIVLPKLYKTINC